VDISPDGRLIACGGWDEGLGVIRLSELATGKLVRPLRGHQSRIDWLTFSPDGKTVVAQVGIPESAVGGIERGGLGRAKIRAWDVATGKERQTGVGGVFTRDGRMVALRGLLYGKFISLWETATVGRRIDLTGHADEVTDVAFSPDGRTLASASMDG